MSSLAGVIGEWGLDSLGCSIFSGYEIPIMARSVREFVFTPNFVPFNSVEVGSRKLRSSVELTLIHNFPLPTSTLTETKLGVEI